MFTKCMKYFVTREVYYPQNMKYWELYQLRLCSLLYLNHNGCQMVFLFVRFVTANRLRQTDVAVVAACIGKKKLVTLTLSGCKLSAADPEIKSGFPHPPYSHFTSGLNLLTKNRRTQTDKSHWNPDISKQMQRKPVCLKSSPLSFVEC